MLRPVLTEFWFPTLPKRIPGGYLNYASKYLCFLIHILLHKNFACLVLHNKGITLPNNNNNNNNNNKS